MDPSNQTFKVVPLGGLGEIGQNMMVIEFANDILIIDAGLRFHEGNIPGIKIGIPDITYLLKNKNKVKGILITHGHEDHIGALPYIIPRLNVPIFSSKFTIALISSKLKAAGILSESELNIVSPNEQFKLGKFIIEFFRVCHSIPDSMGIYIETPVGSVMVTGDFKIDHTPVDGFVLDFHRISSIASKGITLLCSDSTYAEIEGYTPSESTIKNTIHKIVHQANGRIFFVTFASSISRIQQIIDAGLLFNRKISFLGRSITNNVNLAMKLGYLKVPTDAILPLHKNSTRHDKAIIIATGSQGEPTSAIARIASQSHPKISIDLEDTVVFSSSPIPGNEIAVSKAMDNLSRQGATVIHNKIAPVHVHGHGCSEELKMMISLVQPKFFMPIHGEYRHLRAHGLLARELGIPHENIFVTEDGSVIELNKNSARIATKIPADTLFLDGNSERAAESTVFRDRKQLSTQGVITLSVTLDRHTKRITIEPTAKSLGVFDIKEEKEVLEKACKMVQSTLEDEGQHTLDLINVESRVRLLFENFVFLETKKHPCVMVHAKYRDGEQNS